MKKQTLILTIILLIPTILAINIYSGESYSFQSEEFDYYDVIENSSNMDGMNISYELGNITISFHPLFAPDNFTLIFWKDKEPIVVYRGGSGGSYGGSRIIYKDRNITNYIPFEINKTITLPYNYTNQTYITDSPPKNTYLKDIFWILLRFFFRL